MRVDDRLMRVYRRGEVRHLAFAEDYAAVLEACLTLFEATGEHRWLAEATSAADSAVRLFHDDDRGGFFTTGSDGERLVHKDKDLIDNAVPATNSILALELQRLASITGRSDLEARGLEPLRLMRSAMERSPGAFGHLYAALDFYTSQALEIVVVGTDRAQLEKALWSRYLPNRVIVSVDEPRGSLSPLLEHRTLIDGRSTAYVCIERACRQPVTDANELLEQLV
jgi:uncharacterized protein YyaL (SSP411 family)